MNERIEKKLAKIEKVEKKVNKYGSKLSDNQRQLALSLSWKELNEYCGRNYELGSLMESYRSAVKELEELKVQLEKLQKQAAKKNANQEILDSMPEVLKDWASHTEERWNAWDLERKEFLKSQMKELGHDAWWKKYNGADYDLMRYQTVADIEKRNKKAVENLVINLYQRVIDITGNVEDCQGLTITPGNQGYLVINGYVSGKDGKAIVESIEAGGYNIQRWHMRTLVKEVN